MFLASKKPWIEKRIRLGDAMHPEKIIRYLSLNPLDVKKLEQILLGSQYLPQPHPPQWPMEKSDLKQLFEALHPIDGMQLQIVIDDDDDDYDAVEIEGFDGRDFLIHHYERGIEIECSKPGLRHGKVEQYACFAYTGADTNQPFAINWDQQPRK